MDPVYSITEFLRTVRDGFENPHALNTYKNGEWVPFSTKKFTDQAKYLALALKSLGIQKGQRVGIIAEPSAHWAIADFAIMLTGAVSVPLFANISEENFLYEIRQSEVKVVFVQGAHQWVRYEENKELFHAVISLEDGHESSEALSFNGMIKKGKEINEKSPELFAEMEKSIHPEDLATIIYTSGSTGVPKGAEHTHKSLFSLLNVDLFSWDKSDLYLSILPLAHVFGRVLNLIAILWGISTYYFNDLKNFGAICHDLHPTILVVVPRLLEKVHAKMVAKVQEAGHMKRAIGLFAFDLASQEEGSFWKNLFHPLAEKLVYKTLREALGGKLRVVITGGAPLSPHLSRFFIDIGVPLYEGWGLTEACPVTVNRQGNYKVGTIGLPLDSLKVILSPEGELLVKGDNVMRGYYKNPEATAHALDSEGWLHTGDKGTIDEDGFITIIGRLKELFKTSTGEKIAPIPIEQALCKAPFIDMALVIANKRKFASCLLFPDFEILKSLKLDLNQSHLSDEEFLKSIYIKDEMEKLLIKVNSHLNHWEQLHAYRFVPDHLSIDTGELTPSMKIRRDLVEKKYSSLINEMYEEEGK